MEKLIALLFLSRDAAHKAHLRSTSYAQHMALSSFYTTVVDLADGIAEAYQGRHGLMGIIPTMENSTKKTSVMGAEYEFDKSSTGDITKTLRGMLNSVESMRYTACSKNETAIQNMLDEVVALFLTTLYKLENLR